jgi:hypothetical protein
MAQLQKASLMCYEEFNRLFCKGMFKVALINTIQKLTEQSAPQSSAEASQPKPKVELDLTTMRLSCSNEIEGHLHAKMLEKVEDLKFY